MTSDPTIWSVLDVALAARVSPEKVRRDFRLGRIAGSRPVREIQFTTEQAQAAVKAYLTARQEREDREATQ